MLTPSPPHDPWLRGHAARHRTRGLAAVVGVILVVMFWQLVIAIAVLVAVLALVGSVLFGLAAYHKATRPIGELSVLDVALAVWAYGWWQRHRTPRLERRGHDGTEWR